MDSKQKQPHKIFQITRILLGFLSTAGFWLFFFFRPSADDINFNSSTKVYILNGGLTVSIFVWAFMESLFTWSNTLLSGSFIKKVISITHASARLFGIVVFIGIYSLVSGEPFLAFVLPGPLVFVIPVLYFVQVFGFVVLSIFGLRKFFSRPDKNYLLLSVSSVFFLSILIGAGIIAFQVFKETFHFLMI